jgi:hypothetical protein
VPAAGLGLMARIDLPCWGLPAPNPLVEAHEIAHTLGAVQPHAPHSSSVVTDGSIVFYGHCTDEFDIMCYDDQSPKQLTFPCAKAYDRLLDCRHDDYFHTAPSSGTYLASHWNTAMSAFLVRVDPVAGFLDIGSSAFRGDIAWLSATGITRGCTADRERFCPGAEVSRGQMAAFLARALHLPATSTDYFTDDQGSIHEEDINRLAASGITSGCSPTTFCPQVVVTREQMAAFLHRGLA